MEAIILAGGRGTRLQAAVPDLPKPLAPVGERPFISLLLDYLDTQGFTRIILSVGYRRESIMKALGNRHRHIDLCYVVEESPLGTGGALRKALSVASESPVFALNGDSFFALDYRAMYAQHLESGATLTVALKKMADTSRYGRVEVDGDSIVAFQEKAGQGPGWINGGTYLLNKTLFDGYALSETFSFEQDFLQKHRPQINPAAFRADAYFIDIGIPEDYLRAQSELPRFAC